jgi:hypothetical protein
MVHESRCILASQLPVGDVVVVRVEREVVDEVVQPDPACVLLDEASGLRKRGLAAQVEGVRCLDELGR